MYKRKALGIEKDNWYAKWQSGKVAFIHQLAGYLFPDKLNGICSCKKGMILRPQYPSSPLYRGYQNANKVTRKHKKIGDISDETLLSCKVFV